LFIAGFPGDKQTDDDCFQIWGDSGPVEEHILLVENIIEVDPAEEKKKKEKMKHWSKT